MRNGDSLLLFENQLLLLFEYIEISTASDTERREMRCSNAGLSCSGPGMLRTPLLIGRRSPRSMVHR